MSVTPHEIDIRDDAKKRHDLVWNVLQKFLGICDADGFAGIIHADDQLTALRIGKAANPLQILVVPRLLELDILRFDWFHGFHFLAPWVFTDILHVHPGLSHGSRHLKWRRIVVQPCRASSCWEAGRVANVNLAVNTLCRRRGTLQ